MHDAYTHYLITGEIPPLPPSLLSTLPRPTWGEIVALVTFCAICAAVAAI